MKNICIYILTLLAISIACQRIDLPDELPSDNPTELPSCAIGSKATITFSTADLMDVETKGVVNPSIEVETLYLIVFDENGMLVETCKAEELGDSDHGGHTGGRHYTVTLTVTDKPRVIHFVANCPLEQVIYGHETSVIGNMYVDKNFLEHTSDYETSYWARISLPFILVEETEEIVNGEKVITVSLHREIARYFKHVPLLRNYAMITIADATEKTDNTFEFIGYTVYNTIDRGTVAPYNSKTQEFQTFFDASYPSDPNEEPQFTNYSYPRLSQANYEGHSLTSASLVTDFIRDKDGKVIIYSKNAPFYVYERKISVMTDEEEKWRESPPHIIIKGRYDKNGVTEQSPIFYYKMDLVYTDTDAKGNKEIKYYNILRNFKYKFTLTKVHDQGYSSLAEAVDGVAGNNISGSSSTSKLTNVSDNDGRLWVSYTDTTLVNGTKYNDEGDALNPISLKYKYIPNYYGTEGSEYTKGQPYNDLVNFENIEGDVITRIEKSEDDMTEGKWEGWRNVIVHVKDPEDIIHQQVLQLKTNNAYLNRQIRYTLRKKLTMEVDCTPKVSGAMKQPVTVDIKLPTGMTEDMFPLVLNMETYDKSLSPDVANNEFTIPVTLGPSIIDDDSRRGQNSFYYTVTIPTFDDYRALENDGNMKVYSTNWITNKADNASTIYVDNKYFNQGSDSWQNYKYTFSNVSCSAATVGVDKDVTISFSMADGAVNKPVTISLSGMKYTGTLGGVTYTDATELRYTPSSKDVSISSGLKTTTSIDPVSFTIDADDYNIARAQATRQAYEFTGDFKNVSTLAPVEEFEVDFEFNITEEAFNALMSLYPDAGDAGVPMYVTLDRLMPLDNEQLVHSQVRAEGDRYIYRIKEAGTQTLNLATIYAEVGTCSVTLQAEYFTDYTKTIEQKQMEFQSLTLPARVSTGTGKSVNITFELAEGDSNRDVTVTLENMARDGKTELKFNTGNSNNIVTNKNGTYTITNVVTTGVNNATLKVTISADGYESKTATCSNRRNGVFSSTGYSYDNSSVTTLSNAAGDLVDFNFEISDYTPGMTIYVELEGLEPADGTLTKATIYKYVPTSGGKQTIHLKTSVKGTSNCTVKLTSDDFDDSSAVSISRSEPKIVKNKLVIVRTGSSNFNSSNSKNKVSLYTEDPQKNSKATAIKSDITFTRNSSNKKQASNDSAISLDNVPLSTIIYISCKIGNSGPYYTSCLLRDAVNGCTVEIQ